MSRVALALLALLLAAAPPARAQGSTPLFKYGKWVLAAGALGLNVLAARAHDNADTYFHALEDRCAGNNRLCDLDPSGRYGDAESEALYQATAHYDRQARRFLFGGEAALAGSAAIFVWELTRHMPKPDNIPFEPEVRSLRYGTGVGVRLQF
jgi:hypothetical protein